MAMLDKVLGPLLIGSWANSYLFMLEILQIISYFSCYDDPPRLKFMIVLIFSLDFLGTLNNYAMVYLYNVTHWGDVSYLAGIHWPIIVNTVTTALTATIVQVYLVRRYSIVSKHYLVTAFLGFMTLASVAGAVGTIISSRMSFDYLKAKDMNIFIMFWFIVTPSTDILIAAALVWELHRVKTTFKSTQSLIRRLTTSAIQTGSTTSILTIVALVSYLTARQSNISVGIGLCAGRVYALTMLSNLNMRGLHKNGNSISNRSGDINDSLRLSGIRVHRTAVVHVDEENSRNGKSYAVTNSESNNQHLKSSFLVGVDTKDAILNQDLDGYSSQSVDDSKIHCPKS